MTVATIRPLQRPVPLRQSVYDALIDLIVGGELPPGQHLIETDLARQLGVSRQPIREALHRMEVEGWVDLRPSQGAFVHVPTDSEVDELLDVRALLDAETARLAARIATPSHLAGLREILAGGKAAVAQADVSAAGAGPDPSTRSSEPPRRRPARPGWASCPASTPSGPGRLITTPDRPLTDF